MYVSEFIRIDFQPICIKRDSKIFRISLDSLGKILIEIHSELFRVNPKTVSKPIQNLYSSQSEKILNLVCCELREN